MELLQLLSKLVIPIVFIAAIFYVPRSILSAQRYKKQAKDLFEEFASLLAENDGGHQLRGEYIKGLMEQIVFLDSQADFEYFSEVKLPGQVYDALMQVALNYHIARQQDRIISINLVAALLAVGLAALLLIRLIG